MHRDFATFVAVSRGASVSTRNVTGSRPGQRPRQSAAVLPRSITDPRYDIAIVGLGYVGLPTALTYHANGYSVAGFDVNPIRLTAIRAGEIDVLEGDRARLAKALSDDTAFTLTDDPSVIAAAKVVLICVPTPVDEHLTPDLTALRSAGQTVVRHAQPGQVLLLTSTTYVGCTADLLARPVEQRGLQVGRDVFVAFAPERINPGSSSHAQYGIPRVVGGMTAACTEKAIEALRGCSLDLHPVRDCATAELTKLYENTFRAVNISLANEFADISGTLGLDITEVIDAAATKPYGFMPFYPGPGIGGHCIPCDPHYLLWQLRAARVTAPLVETAMTAVALRPRRVVGRALELLARGGQPVGGARILVVGVAYKPGVADVRESPALEIIDRLRAAGARVAYHDDRISTVDVLSGQIEHVAEPRHHEWDLVIVQCVHPQADLGWLRHQPLVLDATYRLEGLPGREVP
jgi:nucleotide sugar dehydrogenase